MKEENFYKKVYNLVSNVPLGKVASYGQIAVLLGHPRSARAVGYALSSLKKDTEDKIPWQRIINSKGRISFKGDTFRAELQKKLLIEEGIEFSENDSIDMKKFGWFPI